MSIMPEKVMDAYIKFRDKRKELKQQWEEKDAELKADMEKLEVWLLSKMSVLGTDVLKNDSGTAYIQKESKFSCADWSVFWEWVLENKRLDMMERRISSASMKEFVEENKHLPPAINVQQERVVRVRRS